MTPQQGKPIFFGFQSWNQKRKPDLYCFLGWGEKLGFSHETKRKTNFCGKLGGGEANFCWGGRGSAFSVPGKGGGKGGKEARGKSELTSRPRQGPGDALLLRPAAREPQGHGARGAPSASDETPAARSAGNEAKRGFVR